MNLRKHSFILTHRGIYDKASLDALKKCSKYKKGRLTRHLVIYYTVLRLALNYSIIHQVSLVAKTCYHILQTLLLFLLCKHNATTKFGSLDVLDQWHASDSILQKRVITIYPR